MIQEDLLDLCINNPLARLHMFWLQKNCSNPKLVRSYIEDHEDRVRWQLHRIYRTRSFFVHAGREFPNLEVLLVNLHDYFISTFEEILDQVDKTQGRIDIDNIIAGISIEHQVYKSYLKGFSQNTELDETILFQVIGLD